MTDEELSRRALRSAGYNTFIMLIVYDAYIHHHAGVCVDICVDQNVN